MRTREIECNPSCVMFDARPQRLCGASMEQHYIREMSGTKQLANFCLALGSSYFPAQKSWF
jgi:hypothetical protein